MGFPKVTPVWLKAQPECMYLLDHGEDEKMKKRITVSLDEKIIWFLRHKQAQMLLELNQPVSISNVVNNLLNKAIKTEKTVDPELDSVFTNTNGMPQDQI